MFSDQVFIPQLVNDWLLAVNYLQDLTISITTTISHLVALYLLVS